MSERVVYLNGEFVPESEAKISVFDRGFIHGDAVYDIARTYGHKPFKLREHVNRLYRSLEYVRIDPKLTPKEMEEISFKVTEMNLPLIGDESDYTIGQRVSRGSYIIGDLLNPAPATVVVFNQPILWKTYAKGYTDGIHLVTPSIRRIPPQSLDPRAKIQNKVNHVMADLEAKQVSPGAYSLMLDIYGYVAENSAANFFMVRDNKLFTPTTENVLEGITRSVIIELAKRINLPVVETHLTEYDLYTAQEAFISSTSYAILPASRINWKRLGDSLPGPLTKELIKAWSNLVGVDIVAQAMKLAERGTV